MSVRSALVMMMAVVSLPAGLVGLPLHASSDLPFSLFRNLNSTAWGYSQVENPIKSGSDPVVERFELRMGDCDRNENVDDCKSKQERIELVESERIVTPLNSDVWYRWKMYFPDKYRIIYPAKTYHIRFVERDEEIAWSFEMGSTGVLWLGNHLSEEIEYYPLIDEDQLLSQWHEFSLNVKWGLDTGFFKVWVNNVQKVEYVGPTCRNCRMRFAYGIIRANLDKYYKSYPEDELPTQVVYYAGLERSSSGIGYPGYIPYQNIKTSTVNEPPKTLKPVLIIETNKRTKSSLSQFERSKGAADIHIQD